MERKIEGQTELEFLEWIYIVIGDDEVDYMWAISGRIGELRATKSVDNIKKIAEGCGSHKRLYPKNDNLEHIYFTCGDNRFHSEDDEPTLCEKCRKKYFDAIKKHKKSWNPNFKLRKRGKQ
ncbi:hypothetical protein LCGC14_1603980 [marine sediment metagenome]|uniref:Uncharacterized protein n=1 Tax=marine sediment metagenome TaxID=412755 RepID=A0A0F9IAC7_9ZZZZ